MKNKEYNLFVVGNGFDLACGYKTRYEDYLKSGVNNSLLFTCINNAYSNGMMENKDWNGFENVICQYLSFIEYLFSSDNVEKNFEKGYHDFYNLYVFKIKNISVVPKNIFISLLNLGYSFRAVLNPRKDNNEYFHNYKEYEEVIKNEYGNEYSLFLEFIDVFSIANAEEKEVERRILNKFDIELKKLEEGLKDYIKKATQTDNEPSNTIYDIKKNYRIKKLLSFNYSDVAERIFNISSDNVMHIHGDVNKQIVLGIEEDMIVNNNLSIDSNYGVFFKRLRRIIKESSYEYKDKVIHSLEFGAKIGIYGHSLDLSDKSILEPIFKVKDCNYEIYCFESIEICKIKLNKLIGIELFEELYNTGRINFIDINC